MMTKDSFWVSTLINSIKLSIATGLLPKQALVEHLSIWKSKKKRLFNKSTSYQVTPPQVTVKR